MSNDSPPTTRREDPASVGEVVEFVKAYAEQETVGPLKGAGRWIGYGAGAAIALGIGLSLILLGLLRLIQSEASDIADGRLSWLPYTIVLLVALLMIALAVMQINKTFLNKEDQQ